MNGAAVLCAHSKNYSTVHDVGEFAGTSGDFYENSVRKRLGLRNSIGLPFTVVGLPHSLGGS